MVERTGGRAAPVKMIWMLVSLGLMISMSLLYIFWRGNAGKNLMYILRYSGTLALLCAGVYVCLSKGSINMALPGIGCMCASLSAQIGQDSDLIVLAVFASIFAGAALGALTGLFTIQSRRNVWLVTGISSLLLGLGFFMLASVISDSYRVTMRVSNDGILVIGVITLMIGAAVCILGGLGRQVSTNSDDTAPRPGGGIRFVWTMIAGALAGLAGFAMAARVGGFSPSLFNSYNEGSIIPALLFGGALIPNLRRSTGEGICGGLAILFGSITLTALSQFFSLVSLTSNLQSLMMVIISALLLIPNLTIGRGNANADKAPVPEPYSQYPQYRPYE